MVSIRPTDLATALRSDDPPRLLDVRQPEEYSIVALPEAKLIPLSDLPERLSEVGDWKDKEVVVYCHHGIRSAHAINWLSQQGFAKLVNLTGGIDLWAVEVEPEMARY